jgi:FkbM family methyltransferase
VGWGYWTTKTPSYLPLQGGGFFMQTKLIKINHQTLNLNYRDDSDLSVIEEIFVDKMYRSVEQIISNTKNPLLDIGAHIGLFSLYARVLNPQVKIIALEPEPTNFALLKDNLKLNHVKNIFPKQVALIANNQTQTELFISENSHNHSTIKQLNQSTNKQIIVPSANLEKIIKQNKIDKIGLLKMDIEGAEFTIFKSLPADRHGLNPEIFKSIENVAIEYHENENNKRVDLENILRQNGFSLEHFPNHYDKRFGLIVGRNKRIHSS